MEVTMKLSTTEKRKQVIERLQVQLAAGIKPRKNGLPYSTYDINDVIVDAKGKPFAIRLSKPDKERIEREIQTLKTRL